MILNEKLTIMRGEEINRHLRLLAERIVRHCGGADNIYLVGIRKGGEELAVRLRKMISEMEGAAPLLGFIDITLYRDDVLTLAKPVIGRTEIGEGINNRIVVLVDDVLYTGRTIRAAMDEIMDYGRPKRIQLACLVDRGGRELPIQADYLGYGLATDENEWVSVRFVETDGEDAVLVKRHIEDSAMEGK